MSFALALIAAVLLLLFGLRLSRRPADRRRGILMIIAAGVLVGNVIILTI